MYQVKAYFVLIIALIFVLLQETEAKPYMALTRQKRTSDQRLAELETLIALSKMKNKMVTIPVGFGRVDPLKIGRRKRFLDAVLRNLFSDVTSQENSKEEEINSEENDVQYRNEDIGDNLLNQLVYR